MGTARQSVQCKPINHVRRFALYIKFTVSNKLVHSLYFMKKVIQERKVVHKSPNDFPKLNLKNVFNHLVNEVDFFSSYISHNSLLRSPCAKE